MTNSQLCELIKQAVADRPDLYPPNKLKYVRTEMLNGKPMRCYIEKKY